MAFTRLNAMSSTDADLGDPVSREEPNMPCCVRTCSSYSRSEALFMRSWPRAPAMSDEGWYGTSGVCGQVGHLAGARGRRVKKTAGV